MACGHAKPWRNVCFADAKKIRKQFAAAILPLLRGGISRLFARPAGRISQNATMNSAQR
jgi:hypothetical protein